MKNQLIIAGPCSAETEEQLLQTASKIALFDRQIIFRAGIWKPRTRPNSFEGVGSVGLKWLSKVKKIYGLEVMTEVATARHVEECLNEGISRLWIGARTVVNPFSVQEIADAMKGKEVHIYIKNPINPDIQLWIGAIERLQNSGVKNICLIHRGFASYHKSDFRNEPLWQIPIEMKRLYPELPIICDISHIAGNRKLLNQIAQKAADIDLSGLMVETHIHPEQALSDAHQQITPLALEELLSSIQWRNPNGLDSIQTPLIQKREEINTIDQEIWNLIGKRMKVAEEIGELKKNGNIPILQTGRWNEILNRSLKKGEELGLSNDFVLKYLDAVHIESINKQNKIMSNHSI